MANGLNKTKRRIASIESTEKTTKAMGLIAMVKLKRYLSSYENQLLYSKEYLDLMSHLFAYDQESVSHYGRPNNKAKGTLYLIITSDLGLCGAYNSNIYKFVDRYVKKDDTLAPFGKKGINHFKAINQKNLELDFAKEGSLTDFAYLHELGQAIKEAFDQGKYKRICLIYTHYVNSLKAVPMLFQLLPVQIPMQPWEGEDSVKPEFDSSPRELIHALMGDYLASQLYDRITESNLSEQSMRRNAMDSANDNADELLDKLRIEYNKARQGAITQEITEVVSGASVEQ